LYTLGFYTNRKAVNNNFSAVGMVDYLDVGGLAKELWNLVTYLPLKYNIKSKPDLNSSLVNKSGKNCLKLEI